MRLSDVKSFLVNKAKTNAKMVAIYHRLKPIYYSLLCIRYGFPLRIVFLCHINVADMPHDTIFGHPFGIVIRGGTKVGNGCIFRQNVTIGQRKGESTYAVIGNNVSFGAGSIILGDVTIGDGVTIGAGAIVLADVPDNAVVVGVWK